MHEATERLIRLGLSEKEASVYLAMLELGPTGVGEISDKAQVNRSTTYLTIEGLKKRGLISSVDDGKRIIFSPESPSRLEAILHQEREDVERKHGSLVEAMPYFMGLFNSIQGKPSVRYFEGDDGIMAAREILMHTDGEYRSFTAVDEGTLQMANIGADQRLRMSRRVKGKLLFSVKPGCQPPSCDLRSWQVKEIPFDRAPFTGEINIVGSVVTAFVVTSQPIAFVVENPEMAGLFRALFDAAWLQGMEKK